MKTCSNISIVPITSPLDRHGVERWQQPLLHAVQSYVRVIVDLSGCVFIDERGIALLLSALRRARMAGCVLSLDNAHPQVYRALAQRCLPDLMGVRRCEQTPEVRPATGLPQWRTSFSVGEDARESLFAAREELRVLLSHTTMGSDACFDLVLAGGEALGNAMDHTSGCGVVVTVSGWADRVVVEVADCGCGVEVARSETPKTTSGCIDRGKGISLMRMLVDEVRITRKSAGQGTVVRLTKLL